MGICSECKHVVYGDATKHEPAVCIDHLLNRCARAEGALATVRRMLGRTSGTMDAPSELGSSVMDSTSRQTEAPQESGTLRGDYERMAFHWLNERDTSSIALHDLAALLARVADEERASIVAWLRAEDAKDPNEWQARRHVADAIERKEHER